MLYLACNDRNIFLSSEQMWYKLCLVKMYLTPYRISWIMSLLDLVLSNIPTGTTCAPLVADLF